MDKGRLVARPTEGVGKKDLVNVATAGLPDVTVRQTTAMKAD